MEEGMEIRKSKKTKHIAIILLIILVGIPLSYIGFWFLNSQNNIINMDTNTQTEIQQQIEEQNINPENYVPLEYSGDELFYKELDFSDTEIVSFEIAYPARIWVEWSFDNPADFLLFNEVRCNDWIEYARLGISKLRTNEFTKTFSGRTDINENEEGEYCFIFFPEGSKQTQGIVKIIEIARF